MKGTENYYLGLDMGTNSVGWAVTDEHYNLLRAKGKDLWGVRLFDEANTAVERRTNRISRRRRQREKARIGILKEFFAEEINKIDPGFYRRCDESKFWKQDRSADNQQPYALFSDKDYTDCDYYRDYPTIFHLREELIRSKQPHDVRLVYLAVLNIFKHRGHFLNVGDMNIEKGGGMDDLWNDMRALAKNADIELPETVTGSMIEAVLADGKLSKTRKYEELLTVLEISKAKDKKAAELIKLLCGMSAKCSVLFKDEIADEEIQKKSLLFGDINYEAAADELEAQITDKSWELVEKVKEIYDNCLLSNIRKGCTYLSQARVKDYEKHKADLRLLKSLVAQYVPEEYDGFFRKMEADNYSAYVKSVNSKKEKVRRNEIIGGNGLSRDNFYKSVKKLLQQMPEDDERVEKVYKDIECGSFMPKQLTASNGVIPNQLHLAELHVILENASEYLPFLRKTDDTGLSIREKIEQLFKFQIPYYVGPVNDYHKGKGGSAWVVRTGRGQVLPWNMEEKIDLEASREEFILKMVRRCTYLRDEKVLPKNSLIYEKYMVLNELNNLKIRGEKPSVELKQSIYNDLFMTGEKVTAKKLKDYLAANGIIEKDEDDVISGIDGNFNTSLSSMGKFTGVLGERAKEWNIQQAIEDIIFWRTVYSKDKNMVRKSIDENYPELFSDSEKRKILGFKFRDWGRFSREFLELEGIDKETGEVMSILQRLWEKNDNLMQLLSERYTYQDALQERIQQAAGTLSDITYKDIEAMNLSAPVRRMVWQTLLVLQDLRKVLEKEPKKIFVEMTRGDGKKMKESSPERKNFRNCIKNAEKNRS